MLRTQMTTLIKRSIQEELKLEDYSTIYYKIRIADKYTEGGVFNSSDNQPDYNYLIGYADSLAFFRIYNEALSTDDRFNIIDMHFDRQMNPQAEYTWDQGYYDADVEGNKQLKKNRS